METLEIDARFEAGLERMTKLWRQRVERYPDDHSARTVLCELETAGRMLRAAYIRRLR